MVVNEIPIDVPLLCLCESLFLLKSPYGGNNAHNSILSLHLRTIGLLSHFLARCLWFYERYSTSNRQPDLYC
jgi:hypothetical protein